MDLCKYAYYKPEEKYMPYLYCKIDDNRCMYSKKCLKVEKFIPLENELWRECYKFIMNKKKEIPNGANYIQTYRINKRGKMFLYVEVNDAVIKIPTDLTEINQDYVYLKKMNNGNYKVSLTPFPKKTYYSNKKKTEDNE